MTITFPNITIPQLSPLSFIGGTYKELTFYPFTSSSAVLDISTAEKCYWSLAPYSQPDFVILEKECVNYGTYFRLYLTKNDTFTLSGKYIQTVYIQSISEDDYTYKIAQGEVNILPAIRTGLEINDSWWLASGMSSSDCVAAYLAKGAESYEDSKINLVNPGVYTLYSGDSEHSIPDTYDPDWTSGSGWEFIGSNSDYLAVGYDTADLLHPSINKDWSAIIKYVSLSVSPKYLFGTYSLEQFGVKVDADTASLYNGTTDGKQISTPLNKGIIGFAGKSIYYNGEYKGVMDNYTPLGNFNSARILIGAYGNDTTYEMVNPFTGWVQAIAFYNKTLTSLQMKEIANYMAYI